MAERGVLNDYLHHLRRRNLSPRSITAYLCILRRADDTTGGLLSASRPQLETWLDTLNLTARSRYTYISALHGFYLWAISEDHATADPTLKMARPRLPRTVPRPISTADLEMALSAADTRMRLWLCLAAYQGLRCQEIAGIEVDDVIDGNDPPVLVVRAGKGRKERVVPLHPETLAAFALHGLPRAGPVFRRQDRPGRVEAVKPHRVSELIAEHLHGLGINATGHQARHWFGTHVYAASLDLRLTQELMGHAHPSTTAGYVKYAQHQAADVVARLSIRPGVSSRSPGGIAGGRGDEGVVEADARGARGGARSGDDGVCRAAR